VQPRPPCFSEADLGLRFGLVDDRLERSTPVTALDFGDQDAIVGCKPSRSRSLEAREGGDLAVFPQSSDARTLYAMSCDARVTSPLRKTEVAMLLGWSLLADQRT